MGVIKIMENELWEKVKKEFPNDPALQQVHYARLKIQEKTKGMSDKEYVEFINETAKNVLAGIQKAEN